MAHIRAGRIASAGCSVADSAEFENGRQLAARLASFHGKIQRRKQMLLGISNEAHHLPALRYHGDSCDPGVRA